MYLSNVWNTNESIMAEIEKLTPVLIDITKKKIPLMKSDKQGQASVANIVITVMLVTMSMTSKASILILFQPEVVTTLAQIILGKYTCHQNYLLPSCIMTFFEKHDQDCEKGSRKSSATDQSSASGKVAQAISNKTLIFYHDIFVTEFNIYFGYPRLDTYDTRDSFLTKIEEARAKGEQTMKLNQEHEAHKTLAQREYQAFHHNQKLSEESRKNNTLKTT